MKLAFLFLLVVLLAGAAAMLWQHFRYLHARREIVEDRQPLVYGSSVFHVVTFLRVANGADVIDSVRKLKGETDSFEGVSWIYAGKVALNARSSSQLPDVDWSAVVMLQYPSRQAYEAAARSETYRQALAQFPDHYSHGMQRSALLNLSIPQLLLGRRLYQIVTREPSAFPFEPAPSDEIENLDPSRLEKLLSERELGARAVMVVNLMKEGNREQRAANRGYGMRMMGMMAEGGHGPMHMGRAVRLEGDPSFDSVAIVYYPGVEHFAAMVRSRFFQGIIGGKQLGDTQASVTVPILAKL